MENINPPENQISVSYILFDPSTRALLGSFFQVPAEDHVHRITVSDELRSNWPAYRMNEACDGVELASPGPAAPPQEADYTVAVQAMLDAKPRERRYDGILSATTYATSTVPKFKAEGQACVEWRDAVWARCYDLMADVEVGKLARPSIEELLAMLPNLVWPE